VKDPKTYRGYFVVGLLNDCAKLGGLSSMAPGVRALRSLGKSYRLCAHWGHDVVYVVLADACFSVYRWCLAVSLSVSPKCLRCGFLRSRADPHLEAMLRLNVLMSLSQALAVGVGRVFGQVVPTLLRLVRGPYHTSS